KLDTDLSFVKAEKKSDGDNAIAVQAGSENLLPEVMPLRAIIAYQPMEIIVATASAKKRKPAIELKPVNEGVNASRRQIIIISSDEPKDAVAIVTGTKTGSVTPVTGDPLNDIKRVATSGEKPLLPEKPASAITLPGNEKSSAGIAKKSEIKAVAGQKKSIEISSNESKHLPISTVIAKPQPMTASNVKTNGMPGKVAKETGKIKNQSPAVMVSSAVKKADQSPIHQPTIKRVSNPEITIGDTAKTVIKEVPPQIFSTSQTNNISGTGVLAATDISERKTKNVQSVFFESDSLVLTLYDNGEVDGDTVSVMMNGQIIFARQGLSTIPHTKTIYFDKVMTDSLSMIMYAENLGSIPPNTGLLIIMDGEARYEVRFSADLSTNAAIIFRRKPKEK
ncbi:MAG: hypothetical protein ABIS01_16650, partial [Ferruginibacter sp.]